MNEDAPEKEGLLSTKASDLTVGQSLKISGIATLAGAALPVLILGGFAGVNKLTQKVKQIRLDRQKSKLSVVPTTDE